MKGEKIASPASPVDTASVTASPTASLTASPDKTTASLNKNKIVGVLPVLFELDKES